MTMVVGAHFDQGIVVIADSHITLQHPNTQRAISYHDILQKILPFAPNVAIAFAGDVNCAAFIFPKIDKVYFLRTSWW